MLSKLIYYVLCYYVFLCYVISCLAIFAFFKTRPEVLHKNRNLFLTLTSLV